MCRAADRHGVSAPIVRTVHEVVAGRMSVESAADRLASLDTDLE
jgi:hypothetical protein